MNQPVFDRNRLRPINVEMAAGLRVGMAFVGMRRTDTDRRPARETLTARLMGDPAPDRVVPDLPPAKIDRRFLRDDEPMSPIYLTFREMRAAYGDPEPTP